MTFLLAYGFAACLINYLIGSIPFGYLAGKLAGKGDIRAQGSGNIGATNVARSIGKGAGLLVLLLDMGKGAAASLVTFSLNLAFVGQAGDIQSGKPSFSPYAEILFALSLLCALLGHMYPLWLRFKGGKGVATALGLYFMFSEAVWQPFCAVWIVVFLLAQRVSLASMAGMAAVPLFLLITGAKTQYTIFTAVTALLIIWRHRQNIGRLLAGEEAKFGFKK